VKSGSITTSSQFVSRSWRGAHNKTSVVKVWTTYVVAQWFNFSEESSLNQNTIANWQSTVDQSVDIFWKKNLLKDKMWGFYKNLWFNSLVLRIRVYDKWDGFNFPNINFPHIDSNIPTRVWSLYSTTHMLHSSLQFTFSLFTVTVFWVRGRGSCFCCFLYLKSCQGILMDAVNKVLIINWQNIINIPEIWVILNALASVICLLFL
jgi:hypothetical protein